MCLRQIGIEPDGAQGRLLRALPSFRGRRLDVPVQQRVTVSQLCVRDRKLRIELNGAFEPFDRLAQTFRGAPGRVVTSGSVKLAGLFVRPRLRIDSGHQYLRSDRSDGVLPLSLSRRCRLGQLAIHRWMAQVAQDSFERRLPWKRIAL